MAASYRIPISKKYLLWCAHEHLNFRLPEITSLFSMLGIPLNVEHKPGPEPFIVIDNSKEDDIRKFMNRTVMVRSAYELWSVGDSYQQLHENLKLLPTEFIESYQSIDKSFKMRVEAFGKKLNTSYKVSRIDALEFLAFNGPVDLSNPDNTFCILEYYESLDPNEAPDEPMKVFFGRWIANGQRNKIHELSLKNRKFIGNTSMEAGLSLLMSNQAQVKPSDIVFDPFVGTGSLLIAAAFHGAHVCGTDIDYLTVHGLAKPTRYNQRQREADENVRANLRQYQMESRYLDVIVSDSSQPLWRENMKFDAIITDPPYGIRESTERVGTKKKHRIKDEQIVGHIPSKIEYNLSQLLMDLLNFAAKHLNINGRLVYWLPVFKEDYTEECVPTHETLKLMSNSEQELTAHSSRLLITMEKIREYDGEVANVSKIADMFRQRYFQAQTSKIKFDKPRQNSMNNG